MAKVYVAGPMRGIPFFNFPAFDQAAKLGRICGWEVLSPAEADRAHGLDESKYPTGEMPASDMPMRVFAKRDCAILIDQLDAANGDAIALLPGWQNSTGAKAELALARWVGLKVLDATTFLPLPAFVFGANLPDRWVWLWCCAE